MYLYGHTTLRFSNNAKSFWSNQFRLKEEKDKSRKIVAITFCDLHTA